MISKTYVDCIENQLEQRGLIHVHFHLAFIHIIVTKYLE